MSTSASTESICRDLCAVLADSGSKVGWRLRLAAAAIALERVVGVRPAVVPVRAAAYSRSAIFRLGGAMVPQHQGEIDHFREQVGPAMILLGIERASPHAVLSIGQCVVEVAHGGDWNDRGVLVRPFVHVCAGRDAGWIVDGLRYGVAVVYEHTDSTFGPLPIGPEVIAFANELVGALQLIGRRAV